MEETVEFLDATAVHATAAAAAVPEHVLSISEPVPCARYNSVRKYKGRLNVNMNS